jgi:ubiquinone/menaquinone biosynthesis C-methylase UbiE
VLDSNKWSSYWGSGAITTFENRFPNSYTGAIKDLWYSRFQLLTSGSKVLDLGCGNGALLSLVYGYSNTYSLPLEAIGVDFADIMVDQERFAHNELCTVRFLANTRMENTTLESGSIDLIISQFGVEYGRRPDSILEIKRVLKSGAVFSAVMHSTESVLLKETKFTLKAVEKVVSSQLTANAEQLVRRIFVVREQQGNVKNDQLCENLRRQLNEVVGKLVASIDPSLSERHIRYFCDKCIQSVRLAVGDQARQEDCLKILADLHATFLALKDRLEDMSEAALSPADFAEFRQNLESAGFTSIDHNLFEFEGHAFGYHVEGRLAD